MERNVGVLMAVARRGARTPSGRALRRLCEAAQIGIAYGWNPFLR
jgi:hypothetical protein